MEKVKILDTNYLIIKNENEAVIKEEIEKLYTDYFQDFDYLVGDWAYNHLRLKGFNNKDNPNFKDINDISKVDEYLKNYCAYGCHYFILEKEVEK